MSRARERTIKALLRYLREWDDIPARELSKRMAATTAGLLARRRAREGPCEVPLGELRRWPAVCKQKPPTS